MIIYIAQLQLLLVAHNVWPRHRPRGNKRIPVQNSVLTSEICMVQEIVLETGDSSL